MQRKTRTILGYAFGLSIALHLLVLPFMRVERIADADEPRVITRIDKISPIPTPKPTPRPTPKPTPRPHAVAPQHAHRIVVLLPHQAHGPTTNARLPVAGAGERRENGSDPNGDATPGPATTEAPATGAPIATPAPEPTRPPACASPNVAAATLQAAQPETPPLAAQQGITGEVSVIVSLDERSHIVGARIAKSPSTILNPAALRAVRDSTFRTEVRDCKPVVADYVFVIDFQSQ